MLTTLLNFPETQVRVCVLYVTPFRSLVKMVLGKGRLLCCVLFLGLLFLTEADPTIPECGPCDWSECPDVGHCLGGTMMDICGCCMGCARGLGQRCDADSAETKAYGTCGEYLLCKTRTDIGEEKEGSCECEEKGPVCGSDGITYDSLCHLLEKTADNPQLSVVIRSACKEAPQIHSRPKDAVRPLGSIMVLDCEAKGYPVPELSWELNMEDGSSFKLPSDNPGFAIQVRGGPEKHMVTGWAQIMRINKETVGTYICVATNSEGEARAAAKISLMSNKDGRDESLNEI